MKPTKSQRYRYRKGWGRIKVEGPSDRQRLRVLQRAGHKCVYCGNRATQVDHVFPVKHGGSTEVENLVAACQPCNADKSGSLDSWYTRHLASQGNRQAKRAIEVARLQEKWTAAANRTGVAPD